jgi:hypothetical protein
MSHNSPMRTGTDPPPPPHTHRTFHAHPRHTQPPHRCKDLPATESASVAHRHSRRRCVACSVKNCRDASLHSAPAPSLGATPVTHQYAYAAWQVDVKVIKAVQSTHTHTHSVQG